MKKVGISILIDEDVLYKLKVISAQRRTTISSICREFCLKVIETNGDILNSILEEVKKK